MREFLRAVTKDPGCTAYKSKIPPRPISLMSGSEKQELAKWLVEIPNLVLQFYSNSCVPDSFRSASMIRQLPRCINSEFVSSLFTNIPLDKTIYHLVAMMSNYFIVQFG